MYFISIFTPNYNNAKYISETIQSILNQSYSNFEYIIIDDCSTDDGWKIITKYAKEDKRIKPYRNKKNLGIVKTRNRGFLLSSPEAKYFAIIDSDDVAIENRIKIQVDFLEQNPDYGLVGSDTLIINENSQIIGYRKFPSANKSIKKIITRYNPFAQSSIVIRKSVIKEVGVYDINWDVCQDYDYWLRVGIRWKLANINKPLIKYRLSTAQIKIRKLKRTIYNTYRIQEKAIKNYGYKDNLYNRLIRIILRCFLIYPKLAYYLYTKIIY